MAGVFEGGGAKGVAYTGALQALWERGLWFSSVAGASAGAITASLVAAGIHPERMGELTGTALRQIEWSARRWRRVMRMVYNLYLRTGALRKDRLAIWLESLLAGQVAAMTDEGDVPVQPITFETLFAATGIELNVVAADISAGRQVVFNHVETPRCGVSQAVVASSSIPFAFPSSELYCESERGGRFHTIVDGGVWTNFPMFLYRDVAYRRSRNLPDEPRADYTIGFLLDEGSRAADLVDRVGRGQSAPPYLTSTFEPPEGVRFRAWEWEEEPTAGVGPLAIERYLLTLGGLGRVLGGGFGGQGRRLWARWPTPRTRIPRVLLQFVDGSLGLLSYLVIGLLAWTLLLFAALNTGRDVWASLLDEGWYAIVWLLVLLALACLIVLLLLGTVWIVLTYPTFRRIGYGLGRTYMAGAGVEPWVAVGGDVVALPLPENVTTLSFGLAEDRVAELVTAAREATAKFLDGLLETSSPGPRPDGQSIP